MMRFEGPERPCKPVCLDIPFEQRFTDDGFECDIPDVACQWACNGTCFAEGGAGVTEVGRIYIDTEERDVDLIARYMLVRN